MGGRGHLIGDEAYCDFKLVLRLGKYIIHARSLRLEGEKNQAIRPH